MEKIKLTQEQANRIEKIVSKEQAVKLRVEGFMRQENKCLNDLSLDQICRVLYEPDSYEVISQYKVGDWIVVEDCPCDHIIGKVQKIKDIGHIEGYDTRYHYEDWWSDERKTKLRHATPEEIQQEKKRRFWDKLGREVDGWKEGDVVSLLKVHQFITFLDQVEININRVSFPGLKKSYTLDEIRLVIPVEKRLDT